MVEVGLVMALLGGFCLAEVLPSGTAAVESSPEPLTSARPNRRTYDGHRDEGYEKPLASSQLQHSHRIARALDPVNLQADQAPPGSEDAPMPLVPLSGDRRPSNRVCRKTPGLSGTWSDSPRIFCWRPWLAGA